MPERTEIHLVSGTTYQVHETPGQVVAELKSTPDGWALFHLYGEGEAYHERQILVRNHSLVSVVVVTDEDDE